MADIIGRRGTRENTFGIGPPLATISCARLVIGCPDLGEYPMRLWIDGGSLHATLRCLDRTGKPKDALDQLHVATQLAFADRLVVGTFGGGQYAIDTEAVRAALTHLGFDDSCIEVVAASEPELEEVYEHAGDTLAAQLVDIVDVFDYGDTYAGLSSERRAMEERFDRVLREDRGVVSRNELVEEIRGHENNGLLMMLGRSGAFWDATRRLVANGTRWTPDHSARLATVCRIFIHRSYADRNGAVYSPGRDRGIALRKIPQYVMQYVQDLPGQVAQGFKIGPTGLPPVAAVLAQRAKGDPRALMEETLRVRVRARPLRRHLKRILDSTSAGDASAVLLAHQEMEQLKADVTDHLKTKPTSVLYDALDIYNPNGFLFALMGAVPFVGIDRMLTAVGSLLRFRRVSVLTEMAAELEVIGLDPNALKSLERGVSAQAGR